MHDGTGTGGALLSRIASEGGNDAGNRLIEIGRLINDNGVLASHLGQHPLYACLMRRDMRGLFHNLKTHGFGAGEGDGCNVRMGDQRLTNLWSSWEADEHARRNTSGDEDFRNE